MERRKPKGQYNQSAANAALENYIGSLVKSGGIDIGVESGKVMDGVAKDFTTTFKKTVKKMSKDAGLSMDEYFTSLEKTIDKRSGGIKSGISVMFEQIIDSHEKESKKLAEVNEKAQKEYLKHVSDKSFKQAADSFKGISDTVKKGLSGQASASTVAKEAFSKLAQARGSLAAGLKALPAVGGPVGIALTALGGAASITAVALHDLSDKTNHMYRAMGTNDKAYEHFTNSLVTLRARTHLTTEALIELEESFHTVGMTSGNTEGINDYIVSAGKAMRITEMNSATAAIYIKTMKDQGKTAGEVDKSLDMTFKTMQKVGGTLEDFNDTVSEGTSLFRNYGAVVGSSLENINVQIMETKGLFKALGIDAKVSGQFLSESFSDSSNRSRRAMFVTSQLGGDFGSVYMDQAQNIAKATEDTLTASILRMQKQLGGNAEALSMTPEQRRQKYGADQAYMLERQIEFAQKSTAAVAGVPREVLNNVQVEYTAWLQEAQKDTQKWVELQKGGSKKIIESFMAAKKAQQMSTEPSVGWQDAYNKSNATFAETSKELGRAMQNLSIIMANTVLPVLNPLLRATNFILDILAHVAGAVQPLLTFLMKSLNPIAQLGELIEKLGKGFSDLGNMTASWMEGFGGMGGILKALGFGGVTVKSASPKEDNFFDGLLKGFQKLWDDIMNNLRTQFPLIFGSSKKAASSRGGGAGSVMELALPGNSPSVNQPSISSGASNVIPLPNVSMPSGNTAFAVPPPPIAYDSKGNVIKNFKEVLPPDARTLDYKSWGSKGIGPWSSGTGKKFISPPTAGGSNVVSMGGKRPVGYISAKGESGNPGIVNMDPNREAGWDYGAWQFNAKAGIPQSFVNWMKKKAPDVHSQLAPNVASIHKGTGGAFGKAWKGVNDQDPKRFMELQRQFAWDHYLGGVSGRLGPELGKQVNSDRGMQEMAFSTAIQHGVGGAAKILRNAGLGKVNKSEVVDNVYNRRAEIYGKGAARYTREAKAIQGLISTNTPPVNQMEETNKLLRQLVAATQQSAKSQTQIAEEARRASLREDAGAVDQLGKLSGGRV